MFDKLLDHVTFNDVLAFCQQFPEGVRVEYKSEAANIDKTVASLANTVGGFFVLGVKTDKKNMPILPIEGMPATCCYPEPRGPVGPGRTDVGECRAGRRPAVAIRRGADVAACVRDQVGRSGPPQEAILRQLRPSSLADVVRAAHAART